MNFTGELMYGLGAALLGVALWWGVRQSGLVSKRKQRATHEAVALMNTRSDEYDTVRQSLKNAADEDPSQGYGDLEAAELLTGEEREQSIVITDPSLPDNPMIYISEDFQRQTGYLAEESLNKNCRFLQGPNTDPQAIEKIRQALKSGSAVSVDVLNYRKDGSEFWNRLRIRPLTDDRGNVIFYAGAQNPIEPNEVRHQ